MIEKYGISVIIPCFNSGRYLREAVQSVIAQRCGIPFEIILVDDGSTDNGYTVGVIKSLAGLYPAHIRTAFIPENSGQSMARNTGINMAHYRYIMPLDSDDRLATTRHLTGAMSYMRRAVEMMDRNPDLMMVYARGEFFEGQSGPWVLPPYNERMILMHNMVPCYAVMRRQDVVMANGYNPDMRSFEDWDMYIALINQRTRNGQKADVFRFPETYYHYRIRHSADNVSRRPTTAKEILTHAYRRSPEIYQRHFDLSGLKTEDEVIDALLEWHRVMADDYAHQKKREYFTPAGLRMVTMHGVTRVKNAVTRRINAAFSPVPRPEIQK